MNGAHVIITSRNANQCDTSAKLLNQMAQTLKTGGSSISIPCDISKEEGCKYVVQRIEELAAEHPHLRNGVHILINNAGTNWAEPIETYPESAWDKVLALNLKSVFYMTRCCLPLLRKSATKEDPASVITTGSINGIAPPSLETYAYSASKAAVHQLTRHLADRLAKEYIKVNAIALGLIHTKMTHQTIENFGDIIMENIPLERDGNAEDLTGIIIYLGSKASAWMTGNVIPLDGGALIRSHL
jgi:NAD(P)-dependent dehydrogenase (short-subunit alcohol dehydrogenase family)